MESHMFFTYYPNMLLPSPWKHRSVRVVVQFMNWVPKALFVDKKKKVLSCMILFHYKCYIN